MSHSPAGSDSSLSSIAENTTAIQSPLVAPSSTLKRKTSPASIPVSLSKRKKVTKEDFQPVQPERLPKSARLDLADAEIYYVPAFVEAKQGKEWYRRLMELDTWYQPTLKMYGRSFTQSRQIVAYGNSEAADSIKYSGTEVPLQKAHPPVLQEIQEYLEAKLGTHFNHCMLNRYDDGAVYIGSHSDNLENLCIASISLGAERDFILKHKKPPADSKQDAKYNKRWPLGDGSLVVMQGTTQEYWKHEIPKQLKIKKGRISLTFRQLVDK